MTSSTDDRRAASSAPRGTSKGTRASARVRLARTMRWATVGSGTRNARAISSVVRPPSRRSVSATRASVESTGWQAVKTRRRRSSPTSSSIAASRSGAAISCWASSSRPSSSCLRSSRLLRRKQVDRAMLRGGHEPGARVVRDARLRPLLERGDERVLRELLGEADVAHDPRETGDEPRRLDPPDRVDRAMRVGSRHGYRQTRVRARARPSPVSGAARCGLRPTGCARQ